MTLSLAGTAKVLNVGSSGFLLSLATKQLSSGNFLSAYEVQFSSVTGNPYGNVMIQHFDEFGTPLGAPIALASPAGLPRSTAPQVVEMDNGTTVVTAIHYATVIQGQYPAQPTAIYAQIGGSGGSMVQINLPAGMVIKDYTLHATATGFSVTASTAPDIWPYTVDPVDTVELSYSFSGQFIGQKIIENGAENSTVLDTLEFQGTPTETTPLKDWVLFSNDETSAVIQRSQTSVGGTTDSISLNLGGAPNTSVAAGNMAELSDGRVVVALNISVFNEVGQFSMSRVVLQVVDPSSGSLMTLADGSSAMVLDGGAYGASAPKVTALPGGNFVLSYVTNGIHAQEYSPDGTKVGNDLLVTTERDTRYTVEATSDGLVFQWGVYTGPGNNLLTQTVSFTSTVVNTLTGTAGADTLIGGIGVDDTIIGLAGNDTLVGNSGFDIINAGDGDDFVHGGDDNDVINGGNGNDVLLGGKGVDAIDGGAGHDVASYEDSISAVTVDLGFPIVPVFSSEGNDTLTGIEEVWGSNFDDRIFGSNGITTFKGLGGNDVINGSISDDWIVGGEGADRIWGNLGLDTISYADSGAGVQVNLITGTGTGGTAQGDVLGGVEHIVGSNFNDTLTGNEWALNMFGEGGNDTLIGGLKDNILDGGAGNDVLMGGAGNDSLWGGSGIDTASYRYSAAAVTVNLATGSSSGGDAQGDIFWNVENLIGSNFADTLTGSAWTQRLDGGAGNDTLRGGSGNNTLLGSAGADKLYGEAGHDALTGGTGSDTLSGGIGNDSFIYNTLTEGGDTITDFSSSAASNNDVFRFQGSVFGGLAVGGISGNQFQSGTNHSAGTTNIRFFYETDTRILRFDADGSAAGASVIIATLQTGATMTISDIEIF